MRTLCVALVSVLLVACSTSQDGPKPKIESVAPNTIVTAAGPLTITIAGEDFSPTVENAVSGTTNVVLPEVWFVAPDGTETQVPPVGVSFTDGDPDELVVVVPRDFVPPTAAGEADVVYDLKVINPNGNEDILEAAITVTAPSSFDLLGIDPPFGWEGAPTSVTILSSGGFVSTPSVEMVPSGGEDAEPVALQNVAFIDATTITGVVPAGLALGLYDVTVYNPPSDGGMGTLTEGFEVVSEPILNVEAVVPARGTNQADTNVSIYGGNFRDPVRIELIGTDEQVAATIDSVNPVSDSQIDAVFPTETQKTDLPVGFYLVRVTNLDQETYATYSGFVVTSNSANLDAPLAETPLLTGRRMLAGALAKDNLNNRYLYAIGGDTGDAGIVLDTVEVAQLSKFGALGSWHEQKNTLNTPRVGASAVTVEVIDSQVSDFTPVKSYVYVVGGLSDTGAVLGSVERALVLSPDNSPLVTSIASAAGGTLAAGTWYYKVAAVLDATDADNPDGETLASDEAIITLGSEGGVTLEWAAVPGAVGYKVYRTDEVDGVSQREHLITTALVTGTSYTDNGDAAGTEPPLFPGATGVFIDDANILLTPRWGHQTLWAHDDAGAGFIYVLGGLSDPNTTVLNTMEYTPIDAATGLIGPFDNTGVVAMTETRAFFGAVMQDQSNVFDHAGDNSRIIVMGGIDTTSSVINSVEQYDMSTGGGSVLGPDTSNYSVNNVAGQMSVILNDKLLIAGGAGDVTPAGATLGFSSLDDTCQDVGFDQNGDVRNNISNASNPLLGDRALGAIVPGAGFAYVVGGSSDGTDALNTTERLLYK